MEGKEEVLYGKDLDNIFFQESVEIMEGSSGSSGNPPAGKPPSELEALQKQHEEKTAKIQELKKQIEIVKLRLEQKKKDIIPIPDEKKEAFTNLSQKYSSLRKEYNALLGDSSRDQQN